MPQSVNLRFVVLFLSLIAVGVPRAAEDPKMVLRKATELYDTGDYDSTVAVIRTYLNRHGKDPSTEYLVPLLVEALTRTGDTKYSQKLLSIYFRRFPKSPYIARMLYLDGIGKSRQEEYAKAVMSFSGALERGLAPALDSLVDTNIHLLCRNALTPEELAELAGSEALHPRVAEIISYWQVRKLYGTGQIAKAKHAAEQFDQRHGRSDYADKVKNIASKVESRARGRVVVGLLAPLSGYDADIGKRIVRGAQVAVDRHNKTGKPKISLLISDTRSSMVATAHQTRALADTHNVSMILGPVLSRNAVVTASMVAGENVVMLSPTATEDGIAGLGRNVFQMNVTMGVLGSKIARYAMENLNIREFAVLSPLSEYGRILSRGFAEEVRQRGGEIVAEESFDEGANDFRPQFKSLRRKLAMHRWEKEAAAEGGGYNGTRRSARADSAIVRDSVLSVGGLFIPAEAEDVVMLAPQVFFYKIQTQMLGATGWHNPKVILDGKRYVNNAIFVTNFETEKHSDTWKNFRDAYHARFSMEPDRVAALGYDAAKLACRTYRRIGAGASAEKVTDALLGVRKYHGVSGVVSFDPEQGMNTEAAIMKISNKRYLRVE